jgi:hypothetical protein
MAPKLRGQFVEAVAQLVERRIVIPNVAGSTPVGLPNFTALHFCRRPPPLELFSVG